MLPRSRRDVLRLGAMASLAGIGAVSGCTLSDPRIQGPSGAPTPASTPSSASPTPSSVPTLAGADRAAVLEMELVALATAVRGRAGVTRANRRWLADLAAAHRSHAAALTADPPSPPKVSGATTRTTLAQRERTAARRYRRTAVGSSGADALLWASLSLAAADFADAASDTTPPDIARVRSPRPVIVLSDTAATQELVRQLHAVIYGLQLAAGRLTGSDHDRSLRELRHFRVLRDQEIAWLVRRKAEVPAPEPAYVPSVDPTSAARARRLVRSMLIALQPFAGLMVAAAGDAQREAAIDLLADTVDRARRWGAPISAWPGYS